MDILIVLVVMTAAVFFFVKRRQAAERIVKSFGADIHPKTVAALIKEGEKGALARDGLWVQDHLKDLAERFRGQWIAVAGGEVVAIGSTADEAWKAAASRPGRVPFVRRIT